MSDFRKPDIGAEPDGEPYVDGLLEEFFGNRARAWEKSAPPPVEDPVRFPAAKAPPSKAAQPAKPSADGNPSDLPGLWSGWTAAALVVVLFAAVAIGSGSEPVFAESVRTLNESEFVQARHAAAAEFGRMIEESIEPYRRK